MESLFKKYLKGDPILWIVFIALCIISIIEMYSASSTLAYKAANHTAPMALSNRCRELRLSSTNWLDCYKIKLKFTKSIVCPPV